MRKKKWPKSAIIVIAFYFHIPNDSIGLWVSYVYMQLNATAAKNSLLKLFMWLLLHNLVYTTLHLVLKWVFLQRQFVFDPRTSSWPNQLQRQVNQIMLQLKWLLKKTPLPNKLLGRQRHMQRAAIFGWDALTNKESEFLFILSFQWSVYLRKAATNQVSFLYV